MPLQDVEDLSDNETNSPAAPKAKLKVKHLRMPGIGFRRKKKQFGSCMASEDPRHLANLIRSKCGCKADCFSKFRENQHHVDSWLKTRKMLSAMTKLEKDRFARVLLCYLVTSF